jgi:hypothetical protein
MLLRVSFSAARGNTKPTSPVWVRKPTPCELAGLCLTNSMDQRSHDLLQGLALRETGADE